MTANKNQTVLVIGASLHRGVSSGIPVRALCLIEALVKAEPIYHLT
jgi:hypothetical protein